MSRINTRQDLEGRGRTVSPILIRSKTSKIVSLPTKKDVKI